MPWAAVILNALYQFLIACLLALLEVQIEGPHGWAQTLPTWRWEARWWLKLTNGKPLTGYHACLLSLLLALFHWPLLHAFSWPAEARTMSVFFQISFEWDFLWFLLNPAFGWRNFKPGKIWWFRRWLGPFPADYYAALAASLVLAWASGDPAGRCAELLVQVPLILACALR
ncbi:MAG: hypothetical protein HY922_02955 [Elusimicrobia bacterium]|nr:hypothetical protein [Elusimicrobiota bacterium]